MMLVCPSFPGYPPAPTVPCPLRPLLRVVTRRRRSLVHCIAPWAGHRSLCALFQAAPSHFARRRCPLPTAGWETRLPPFLGKRVGGESPLFWRRMGLLRHGQPLADRQQARPARLRPSTLDSAPSPSDRQTNIDNGRYQCIPRALGRHQARNQGNQAHTPRHWIQEAPE